MDANEFQSTTSGVARRRPAFTIVELLLALTIVGLVATSTSVMLVAVSYGTSSKRDFRAVVVKGKVVDSRLSSAIRNSRAILESGTDYLVLWTADDNPNGTANSPDLAEIHLIERDSGTNGLSSYGFPSTWNQTQIDAANVTYSLTGNPAGFFKTATAAAKTTGSFTASAWATGVTAMQFSLNGTDPTDRALVSYQLTFSSGDLTESMLGAASVRYGAVNGN